MKGNFNEDIDKKIAVCLNYKAEEISASDDMLFKFRSKIRNENRLRNKNIKLSFLKVKTIIVIGVLCILTTVAYAENRINLHWLNQQSKTVSEIKEFPTADTVKRTLGYLPKYAESFEGGFKFKSFNIIDNLERDYTDRKVTNNKVGEFEYAKDGESGNQYLKLTATIMDPKCFYENMKNSHYYQGNINGIPIYVENIGRKEVPDDYVETKEDLKLIKAGILEIAYGADDINYYNMRYVYWYENGIKYMVSSKGYNYDYIYAGEMLNIANAIMCQ
jgi:hypothetical protein